MNYSSIKLFKNDTQTPFIQNISTVPRGLCGSWGGHSSEQEGAVPDLMELTSSGPAVTLYPWKEDT